MSEFLELVGNVGFPIAVSVYLLIRVEHKLGELAAAIGELREAIILLPLEKPWKMISAIPSQLGDVAQGHVRLCENRATEKGIRVTKGEYIG